MKALATIFWSCDPIQAEGVLQGTSDRVVWLVDAATDRANYIKQEKK